MEQKPDIPSTGNTVWKAANWTALALGLGLLAVGLFIVKVAEEAGVMSGLVLILALIPIAPGAVLVLVVILSAILRVVFRKGAEEKAMAGTGYGDVDVASGAEAPSGVYRVLRIVLAIVFIPIILMGLLFVADFLLIF